MPDLDAPSVAAPAVPDDGRSIDETRNRSVIRWLTIAANVAALPVAVLGAVLSFRSLSKWALPLYGQGWNYVVPFVVDFVIVSASLKFIVGAKKGRVIPGWRLMAHAGVIATLIFNAQSAKDWTQVLGMDWPPLVWSAYVELTAAEMIGEWREQHAIRRRRIRDTISLRLWVTAPVESTRVWLRMERRLEGEQADARLEVGIYAAALAALDEALPHQGGRRVRRIIRRQLRAGSLQPHDVLIPLGWHTEEPTLTTTEPRAVLRAVLRQALLRRGDIDPVTAYDTETASRQGASDLPAPIVPSTGEPTASDERSGPVRADGEPSADRQPSAEPGTHRVIDLRDREAIPPATDEDGPQSTGDRHEDAVLIWRKCDGKITGKEMAAQLGALGWPEVSERTALRIIQQVKDTEEAKPTGLLALARRG